MSVVNVGCVHVSVSVHTETHGRQCKRETALCTVFHSPITKMSVQMLLQKMLHYPIYCLAIVGSITVLNICIVNTIVHLRILVTTNQYIYPDLI